MVLVLIHFVSFQSVKTSKWGFEYFQVFKMRPCLRLPELSSSFRIFSLTSSSHCWRIWTASSMEQFSTRMLSMASSLSPSSNVPVLKSKSQTWKQCHASWSAATVKQLNQQKLFNPHFLLHTPKHMGYKIKTHARTHTHTHTHRHMRAHTHTHARRHRHRHRHTHTHTHIHTHTDRETETDWQTDRQT